MTFGFRTQRAFVYCQLISLWKIRRVGPENFLVGPKIVRMSPIRTPRYSLLVALAVRIIVKLTSTPLTEPQSAQM